PRPARPHPLAFLPELLPRQDLRQYRAQAALGSRSSGAFYLQGVSRQATAVNVSEYAQRYSVDYQALWWITATVGLVRASKRPRLRESGARSRRTQGGEHGVG